MNKAALKKLMADYLQQGKADYDAGRMTSAAKDYIETEGVKLGYLDKMDDVVICELCQRAFEPVGTDPKWLRVFNGYTVDLRLQQFRRVIRHEEGPSIEFIDFASPEGKTLLAQMHEEVTR